MMYFQRVLFSLGGSFLYYANHFKVYSSFCASHSRTQKILNPGNKLTVTQVNTHCQTGKTLTVIVTLRRYSTQVTHSLSQPHSEDTKPSEHTHSHTGKTLTVTLRRYSTQVKHSVTAALRRYSTQVTLSQSHSEDTQPR